MGTIEDGNYVYVMGMLLLLLSITWCFKSLLSLYIFKDRMRAWIVFKFEKKVKELFTKEKKHISHILNDHAQSINRNLTILEIGSGPAVNVAYVPSDSKLFCLDPNPLFEEDVHRKLDIYKFVKEIHFVKGYAENIPFKGVVFDAVLSTLTMCVVTDLKQSLEEIKRVLKPNGKLIFLEHVTAADDTWSYKMINFIHIPMNWLMFGCHLNRKVDKFIKEAGFSNVNMQIIYHKSAPFSLRRCILGEATN